MIKVATKNERQPFKKTFSLAPYIYLKRSLILFYEQRSVFEVIKSAFVSETVFFFV